MKLPQVLSDIKKLNNIYTNSSKIEGNPKTSPQELFSTSSIEQIQSRLTDVLALLPTECGSFAAELFLHEKSLLQESLETLTTLKKAEILITIHTKIIQIRSRMLKGIGIDLQQQKKAVSEINTSILRTLRASISKGKRQKQPQLINKASLMLCKFLCSKNNQVAGLRTLEDAIKINKDKTTSEIYTNAGLLSLKTNPTNNGSAAEEYLLKAIQKDPSYYPALKIYLQLLERQKRFKEMIELLNVHMENTADHSSGLFNELATIHKNKYNHDTTQLRELVYKISNISGEYVQIIQNSPELSLVREQILAFLSQYKKLSSSQKPKPDEKQITPLKRREEKLKCFSDICDQLELCFSSEEIISLKESQEEASMMIDLYEQLFRDVLVFENDSNDLYLSYQYYQKAMDHPEPFPGIHHNIALTYELMCRYDLARKHFLQAVDNGHNIAYFRLGLLELNCSTPDPIASVSYFQKYLDASQMKYDRVSKIYRTQAEKLIKEHSTTS